MRVICYDNEQNSLLNMFTRIRVNQVLVLRYLAILVLIGQVSLSTDVNRYSPYTDRFRPYPDELKSRNGYPDRRPYRPYPHPSQINPYDERDRFRPSPVADFLGKFDSERRYIPPPPPSSSSYRSPSESSKESRFEKLFGVLGKVLEKIKIGSLLSGKSAGSDSSLFQSNSDTQSNLALKSTQNSSTTKSATKSKGKTSKLSWLPGKQTSPECDNIYVPDCNASSPYRTIDGSCNNLDYTWWGRSRTPYKRLLYPEYDDHTADLPRIKSSVPLYHLPNARLVALNVFEVAEPGVKRSDSSLLTPYFAEFVSYDISSTPRATFKRGRPKLCRCQHYDDDCFNIQTPQLDEINRDNQTCMTYTRSLSSIKEFDCDIGPREQLDLATHWLDLSIIYGNDDKESTKLRSYKRGMLRSNQNPRSRQSFLPYNQPGQCKHSKYSSSYETKTRCYLSGDKRVEDNSLTTSLATIWLREHNRIATQLSHINPLWSDERLFQETRRIVIAEYQNIIYSEFLPSVIGINFALNYDLLTYREGYFEQYNPILYPQVNNEYATAASRFYQTMLPPRQKFLSDSEDKTVKPISFFMFNNPIYEHKMSNLIRGVLADKGLKVKPRMDKYLQDMLYNDLFYDEETKRWSLSALNIQQGRDHGLPSYNKYRKLCGLCEAQSFSELDHIPPEIVAKLAQTYACPDDIDLFVGLVSEKPLKGALVGPTAACIIAKQFHDLKFADRFYFETSDSAIKFTQDQLKSIRRVRMSDIICRNVDYIDAVQKYAFYSSDFDWNKESRCQVPPNYNHRRHQHHHDYYNHHHGNYYHMQNPNLLLWFEDSSYDCTQYLQYSNTQASFVYSFSNSTIVNSINFYMSYPSLATSGLSASSVQVRCYPVNRTAIITVKDSQTNLNLIRIDAENYNASVLFYIQSVNSLFVNEIDVDMSSRSTFGLYPSSIQSSVNFIQSIKFNADKSSKINLQILNTPSFTSSGNWTVQINDSSSFDLSVSNVSIFSMAETVQVTADIADQNYTSCHLTQNRLSLDFSNMGSIMINQLSSIFHTGGSSSLEIRRIKTFNSTSGILFQAGDETKNATNQNTHIKFELSHFDEAAINELAFKIYDTAQVIAEIEHANSVNISQLSVEIAGVAIPANKFKLEISDVNQVDIGNYVLDTNKTQTSSSLHNISGMVVSNQLSYACDSCELNIYNISSLNVSVFGIESYDAFKPVRVTMGPGLESFLTETMLIIDNSVNSTIYMDLTYSGYVAIEALTFDVTGKTNFTIIDVFNTTISNLNGTIANTSVIGIDLFGPGTNKFAIVDVSDPTWINSTLFVEQQPSCGCQQVEINV